MAPKDAVKRMLFMCGNADGGRLAQSVPTSLFTGCMALSDTEVLTAACGAAHTAAVTTCGSLFTFGSNSHHQLGHSEAMSSVSLPTDVDLPDACTSVACGGTFTVAITNSGEVWAWGDNSAGQLGLGTTSRWQNKPSRVPDLPAITKLVAGRAHVLALSENGEVWVWGSNAQGQLGVRNKGMLSLFATRNEQSTPRVLRKLATDLQVRAVDIAAGHFHSIVATERHGCLGWGANSWYQLGLEACQGQFTPQPQYEPQPIHGTNNITKVAAGLYSSGGIDRAGRMHLCGTDTMSRGILTDALSPQARTMQCVEGPALRSLTMGMQACAAIATNDKLFTWGWSGNDFQLSTDIEAAQGVEDESSQLGHGRTWNVYQPLPVKEVAMPGVNGSGAHNIAQLDDNGNSVWVPQSIACGVDHMAAVLEVKDSVL